MRKVIGLLSIIVTATILLFTQDTSAFMMILYLLILYLGNSFLTNNRLDSNIVPLLTTTELFYILDFYALIEKNCYSYIFGFLAIAFSMISIVYLVKGKKTDLPLIEIENEQKKYKRMKKIALGFLIAELVFNIILISLIDYSTFDCMYSLVMLLMPLLMTVIIIYQGYISDKSKKKDKEEYPRHVISNRPYFMLSMFYLLFLPNVLHNVDIVLKITYVYFFLYIFIFMFYPLARCEYYGFREADPKYRFSWFNYLKKSIIFNIIFIACGLAISLSIYYGCNRVVTSSHNLKIYEYDDEIVFTEADKDKAELEVRKQYSNLVYIAISSDDKIAVNEFGESYRQIEIYAYTDDEEDIYVYTYRKYLTKTRDHDLGEVKEYGYKYIADFDKADLVNMNLIFY